MNLVIEQVRQESQKNTEQIEKITKEQTRKMNDIQAAMSRLEDTFAILDVSCYTYNGIMWGNHLTLLWRIETNFISI